MKKRVLGALWVMVILAGCGGGSGGGGTDVPGNGGNDAVGGDVTLEVPQLPPFQPPEQNAIVGQVVSSTGQGVEGVTVSTDAGTAPATTNYDGFYSIADVPAKDRIVLSFEATGFLPATKIGSMTEGLRITVNAILLPRAAAQPVEAGLATFEHATVAIDNAAIVDKDGKPATGKTSVRVTPIPIRGAKSVAVPGDFSAITEAGGDARLETFAMSDFQLVDESGAELAIGDGKTADIEILLPADTTLKEGDTVPAWHFDKASGKWNEEGTGTVVKYSQDPERLAFKATVSHFSTWNCDKPMETTCVSGQVKLCDGTPAAGADLRGEGVDYDGSSTGFASGDGSFCIPVKTGATVSLTAAYGFGADRLVGQVLVTSGSDPSECPGPCTNADITLPCTPEDSPLDCDDTFFAGCKSCVKGRVVGGDGVPRAAVIKASMGTSSFTVVTDDKGNYCAPAAQGALVTLSATGSLGESGVVTAMPQNAGKCPDCEAAPDIVLSDAPTSGEEDGIDFGSCGTDVDGITLSSVIANGADPRLGEIDTGWVTVYDAGAGSDESHWRLELQFIKAGTANPGGSATATIYLDLDAAPTGGGTYAVEATEGYVLHGTADSAVGGMTGLGNETYLVGGGDTTVVGAGFIQLDQGFSKVGDPVTGSFSLTLASECAPRDATLTLAGSLSTTVHDPTSVIPGFGWTPDSPEFRYWVCSLYDLFVLSSSIQGYQGAVQILLDGALSPAGDATFMNYAKYDWEDDRFSLAFYGQDLTLMLTVDNPVDGSNPLSSGTLMFSSNNDCFYDKKAGSVTISGIGDGVTEPWLTGSFDVDFTKSSFAEGSCPDHKVSGQFGAAVCR